MHTQQKQITCVVCPLGCDIAVCVDGGEVVSMSGQGCKRGESYAAEEFFHPKRIFTSSVKVMGADVPLVSVRSNAPIPKELLMDCMAEIQKITLSPPICRYDLVVENILDTGVNIVTTGEVN